MGGAAGRDDSVGDLVRHGVAQAAEIVCNLVCEVGKHGVHRRVGGQAAQDIVVHGSFLATVVICVANNTLHQRGQSEPVSCGLECISRSLQYSVRVVCVRHRLGWCTMASNVLIIEICEASLVVFKPYRSQ